MISWFQREIIDNGRLALFLCFLAFVVTFVATRLITRMIRAGRGPFKNNVSDSGVHVHHAVPGVILLSVGAVFAVGSGATAPWAEMAGVLVGIGLSLVLDEFSLILHLDDVYWSQEGRISVEVVSLAFACLGLVVLGVNPFQVEEDDGSLPAAARIAIIAAAIVLHFLLVIICLTKGKYKMALIGIFVPILVDVSAIRLARPTSRWAKRRYGPEKMAKATRRAEKWDARFGPITGWLSDLVGGKVSETEPEPEPSLR
jgi:hypothetical protein